MNRAPVLALAAVVAWSVPAAAEEWSGRRLRVDFVALEPGPRLPVQREIRRIGTVLALDSSSVRLAVTGRERERRIVFGDIQHLALSEGRTPQQGAGRGSFYGAALGLLAGAAFNAFNFSRNDPDRDELGVGGLALTAEVGAALGAAAGAASGGESWREMPVSSLRERPR